MKKKYIRPVVTGNLEDGMGVVPLAAVGGAVAAALATDLVVGAAVSGVAAGVGAAAATSQMRSRFWGERRLISKK